MGIKTDSEAPAGGFKQENTMRSPLQRACTARGTEEGLGKLGGRKNQFGRKDNEDLNEGGVATDTGSVGHFQKIRWRSEFRWSIHQRCSHLVQETDRKMCLVLEW